MTASALFFQAFWATVELRQDVDVLLRCGRIQAQALAAGADSPAGWFLQAAGAYTAGDAVGTLARRACLLTASTLAAGSSH